MNSLVIKVSTQSDYIYSIADIAIIVMSFKCEVLIVNYCNSL